MRKVALAKVKAEFSSYIDDAQHRGRGTLVTRHGKIAAVILPAPERKSVVAPRETLRSLMAEDAKTADYNASAVEDLFASRR